jgi:two-component system, chemotaxis family, protein-glutamate methylesterase/glutaminase
LEKLRVLLADVSVTSRKITADAVERTSLGAVVHTAPNSSIALEWLQQCVMDVVLLGASMAGQDDLNLLSMIKASQPDVEVIILSDGSPGSAEVTIKALELGAFDFILKTEESDIKKNVEKIRNQLDVLFAQIKVKKYSTADVKKSKATDELNRMELKKPLFDKPELVLIASSTGGPAALEIVFKQLPVNFPVPILVVQHMPAEFTAIFAHNLDKVSELDIVEAIDGCALKNGQAVIAVGGSHMTVIRSDCNDAAISLDKSPYVNGVRPSADILFNSVAKAFEGKNILAVILTGMGNDGMQGVSELKSKCNCYCMTQSESTSIVYGMPRCVSEMGLSDETVDIGDVAGRICRLA